MFSAPGLSASALAGSILMPPVALPRALEAVQIVQTRLAVAAAWPGAPLDQSGLIVWDRDDRGYDLVEGLAIIPIEGVLLDQLGFLRPLWGMATGYDGIRASVANALEDARVETIALRINSYGGLVSGCFDLAEDIRAASALKPVAAVIAESAYSAAYALACAAEAITISRTGGCGSIGVIQARADISQMLEREGVRVEFRVSDGADRKADGHPETPISEEETAAAQAEINVLGDIFYETVGRFRGLSAAQVKGFKAACFLGEAAVDAGLADKIFPATQALTLLAGL